MKLVGKLFSRSLSIERGFTIVELLVVIVVIGILAALTVVSYNGISTRSRISALQSNLSQMAKKIEVYKVQNSDTYPASLAAGSVNIPDTGTYNYQSTGSAYCLSGMSNGLSYKVTNTVPNPIEGICSGVLANGDTCPSGFIVVPGNSNFGTTEFCVMKYEAKNVGGVATSQASGTPWVTISQTSAITTASAACSGCHLITEAEWMTIVANVLSVSSNWSGGSVGSGYIYSGHNDNSPANALAASSDENDGYSGTGNTSGNQRRTLTLTNGEVIWDFSGNVYEPTSQTLSASNIGISSDSGFNWRQWTNPSLSFGSLPSIARPSGLVSSPGLSNAASWDSSNGIGTIYANYADSGTRVYRRGGSWDNSNNAGVMSLNLGSTPSAANASLGFRVAK